MACESLSTVILGKNVTTIDQSAFMQCSSISNVYYLGSSSEWSEIKINSSGNSDFTSARRYYYSENEPSDNGNYWHYVDGKVTVW